MILYDVFRGEKVSQKHWILWIKNAMTIKRKAFKHSQMRAIESAYRLGCPIYCQFFRLHLQQSSQLIQINKIPLPLSLIPNLIRNNEKNNRDHTGKMG